MTDKNIRMIIMDLDGTLLMNDDHSISEGNRKALLKAHEQGICIVAATGRSYTTLPNEVITLKGLSYAITSNGAVISEMPSGKVWRREYLQESIVRGIIEAAQAMNELFEKEAERIRESVLMELPEKVHIIYEAFIDGIAYTEKEYHQNPLLYGSNPREMEYVQTTRVAVDGMEAFIRKHIHELDNVSLICHVPEFKEILQEKLKHHCPQAIISSSAKRLIEFSNPGCSKWTSVEHLCKRESIPEKETIAFGDSGNDLQMIENAGIGVCMANGTEHLKKAADYTAKDYMEDGIACTLYDLGIIKP